ncbi:MAG: carboxypeptidase M32 [Erysipelotrichaceae bacterium]|nr:carboxypeptidase M32 [Erysipelotrichaceae bacterium]
MTTEELWKQYQEKMFRISAYDLVLTTTYFDAETVAPIKGADYRSERMAYLYGEAFNMETDPELISMLEQLKEREDLTELQQAAVFWHLRQLDAMRHIPQELYVEASQLQMDSNVVWKKAKAADDYKMFEPYLLKTIEMSRKMLEYRQSELHGYDILLDDFEPGMTREKYDRFFELIKERLVPLIHKISEKQQFDCSFNSRYYPKEQQKKLMYKILEYMQFDLEAGMMGETEHPFTDSLSPKDIRITTHYYDNNLLSCIFSVVHEAGHATYNYQIRDDVAETFCFDSMSSGMHESQSRLMENYLARNSAFWDTLFPYAKELFPEQLADVDQEKFMHAVNASQPSLIRTEADELTYPLHILVRYEIEKGLFDGTIDEHDLENIWNDKYEEYLGVRPQKPSDGILQDVHWSGGSFGYFPTYALGSGYAAQFMHAMRKDLDVEACMHEGQFGRIREWLREHIHQYGGMYLPQKQIEIATGEPFDPEYYVEYLTEKYSRLYWIE